MLIKDSARCHLWRLVQMLRSVVLRYHCWVVRHCARISNPYSHWKTQTKVMKIVAKYFVGSNSWKIYSKDKKDSSKENTKEMKISFTKSRGNGAMCNCNSKKIYGNIVVPFLIKWGINKKMAKFFLELATLTFPLLKALIWQMLMTTKIVKWSCFSQVLKLHKLITKKFSTNFLKVKVKTICLRPEASKQG